MPIYAYRCESCGHAHDALQKISDAPLVDCPACGQPSLKKQVTAAGFQLKGSGWYVTDFRNNSSAGSAPAASAAPASSADASAPATASTTTAPSASPPSPPSTTSSD